MAKKDTGVKKGLSLRFTIPLPDKYAPISVSIWTERSIKPDEKEDEMIVNIGKELVRDMKIVSESLVQETLELEKVVMEELNDN